MNVFVPGRLLACLCGERHSWSCKLIIYKQAVICLCVEKITVEVVVLLNFLRRGTVVLWDKEQFVVICILIYSVDAGILLFFLRLFAVCKLMLLY